MVAVRLKSDAAIGLRMGRIVSRYEMAKHFTLKIGEGHFGFERKSEEIRAEATLDGIYVIRTNVPEEKLLASEVVSAYKRLSRVEDAFRSLKGVDLQIRSIYHRLEERLRAHAFLCLLAECLAFHLRAAWAPLTFADEEKNHPRADTVAKAEGERPPKRKRARRRPRGGVCHSFHTLLAHLSTLTAPPSLCLLKGASPSRDSPNPRPCNGRRSNS